ncbi:MAG: DUF494 family protein [Candidatus Kapabacteria bacterium]|jgi:uncharacterized protein Smg (DUF494 family)|nr:DUF494 family protein [Candidatus Kapabacteria bacterium]
MFERIIEIIAFVIMELRQNKNIAEIDLDKLSTLGYSKSEISTAFSWIVDRMEFSDDIVSPSDNVTSPESFRVLHEAEKHIFTPEAWGVMVEFHSLGLLKNNQIENIIERGMLSGIKSVGASQLKSFIATMLFNLSTNNIPGSRVMLKGNETIH